MSNDLLIVQADARRIPLADAVVQCVVTSPPYWGLRKYAGAQDLIWGGTDSCTHEWGKIAAAPPARLAPENAQSSKSSLDSLLCQNTHAVSS